MTFAFVLFMDCELCGRDITFETDFLFYGLTVCPECNYLCGDESTKAEVVLGI